MDTIKKKLSKKLGYNVTDAEVISFYYSGQLSLTDKEENSILKYIEKTL